MELIVRTFDELTTRELYEILRSRSEIFIVEQKILCQEMDCVDYDSLHCFFYEGGRVTAYLRAYRVGEDVKIGRVLTLRHGQGLGGELLTKSMDAIERHFGRRKLIVDAQKHAIGFYERYGFSVTSGEFLEEGIVHVATERAI